MYRTFIAINIPLLNSINDAFLSISETLKNEKIKWVNLKQMHLTVKFLGDTKESDIPEIAKKITTVCANIPSFDLQIKGSGVFKNFRNPRVIWLGLEENETLQKLYNAIDEAMVDFGFKSESRTFKPHLTLGRIKWIDDLSLLKDTLNDYQNKDFGACSIDHVVFYRSVLSPQGPEYSVLGKIPLKGRNS